MNKTFRFFNEFIGQLQGRASATFVVLAGIGLGLSSFKKESQTVNTIVKRSIFLLILGLLNMTIFEGDILHYYAFYFLFGVFLVCIFGLCNFGLFGGALQGATRFFH